MKNRRNRIKLTKAFYIDKYPVTQDITRARPAPTLRFSRIAA